MNKREYIRYRCHNAETSVSRRLRRERERRRLTDTIDALTLPRAAGDDIPVVRLPPSRDTMARIELRDALLAHSAAFDEQELKIANLFLLGHSPRAVFAALGIPSATGYRRYGELLRQLKEVARD